MLSDQIIGQRTFYSTGGSKESWKERHEGAPQAGGGIPGQLSTQRRRIIYRCQQRGWLELDILLGDWAVHNVPRLPDEHLGLVEHLLEEDTPEVLAWALGAKVPPAQHEDIVRNIRRHVEDKNGQEGENVDKVE